MYFITGDTHGDFADVIYRIRTMGIKEGDTLIVLGDFGANFWLNKRDEVFKREVSKMNVTLFAIHGNHEERPENISSYKTKEWNGGIVFYEEKFPFILFAKDGEIYDINGKKCFVCGGAYSVDKYYRTFRGCIRDGIDIPKKVYDPLERICRNYTVSTEEKAIVDNFANTLSPKIIGWFKSEQPSDETKRYCEKVLDENKWSVDCVFTHTSPERYEPVEVFLPGLNQDNVDKTTEIWLNSIEEKLDYKKWYAGHYHTDKIVNDKFRFLYHDVITFD